MDVPRCLASAIFFLRSSEYASIPATFCYVAQLRCKALLINSTLNKE